MIGEICSVDWLGQRLLDTSCSVDSSMSNETGNATKLLILDCRSPDEYSLSHVIGSLFVAIPSIVHRRLRTGRCTASTAINAIGVIGGGISVDRGGCTSGLVELTDCCRRSDRVVLYDSGVDGAENNGAAGGSASIIDVLLRLLTAERCSISRLEGGFSAFKIRYGFLCTGSQHLQHEVTTSPSILKLSNLCLSPLPTTLPNADELTSDVTSCSTTKEPLVNDVITGSLSPARTPLQRCRPMPKHPFPVEVLPYLYLGDAESSRDLECMLKHDIRYVVNVTRDISNTFAHLSGFRYLRLPVDDHWSENMTPFFSKAIAFIDEARREECGVLVHCLAGVSRSVTVTVAYIMSSAGQSLDDAFDHLVRYRPNISPNFSFMRQLMDFERALRDTADVLTSDESSRHHCLRVPTSGGDSIEPVAE